MNKDLLEDLFNELYEIVENDKCRKNVYDFEWLNENEFLIKEKIHSQCKVFLIYYDNENDTFNIYIQANWTYKYIKKTYKTKRGVFKYVSKQIAW